MHQRPAREFPLTAGRRALGLLLAGSFAAAIGESAADVTGWTSTVRPIDGGYLINIFAVTNNPSDRLFYVSSFSGCGPQYDCGVSTNSVGGFLQSSGDTSVFQPKVGQDWTASDSFLTQGGSISPTTGAWRPNPGTLNEPLASVWNVTYFDTEAGESVTVNSFETPSNLTGFSNPNTHAVPPLAGWYQQTTSPARDLSGIAGIRQPYIAIGGVVYGSSNPAAAASQWGFLVAQFHVAEWGGFGPDARRIDWRMAASVSNGPIFLPGVRFSVRVGEVCVGDINHDATVDGVDLGLLLAAWGPCGAPCASDMNNSGAVDGVDLGILLVGWGPCTR